MDGELIQAGERLVVHAQPRWLDEVLAEAAGDAWRAPSGRPADVEVLVEPHSAGFDVRGWEPLTRGAYRRGNRCVVQNACGAGFDLHVDALHSGALQVVARWRPPRRERLAALLLRARFHLLARAVLVQYPALWQAGRRGRVPLHAAAVAIDGGVPLLAGPGGVGRSTVLLAAAQAGGRACSDNLVAGDVERVHGLVEPMRVEGGAGRRMAHGRRERPLPGRVDELAPDRIVVLRRGGGPRPTVAGLDPGRAAAVLTGGTYMAGELRRYWALAATLAMGTGMGPVHPPVADVARALAARLPATEITLAGRPTPDLAGLLTGRPTATGARS
ncbi:hypothetical protein [Pseudonocardia acidicola]|uniref:Hpr(Ser) kinase/phosphatase n=1 Tax=Pseudonocardia acidicola TaxID=2724939 RepID=A0ABX1S6X3_9PSEU|nr:hypothetical protein [Pseudonocardia acidicola]NMH96647.1 hypothetical protein [Pseudonocardia acidicola]